MIGEMVMINVGLNDQVRSHDLTLSSAYSTNYNVPLDSHSQALWHGLNIINCTFIHEETMHND